MIIDEQELVKAAAAVRIKLSAEEKTRFNEQLNEWLHSFEHLNELDVSQVQPTSRGLSHSNVMRDDAVKASLPLEQVFLNAPEHEGDQFKVPAILE